MRCWENHTQQDEWHCDLCSTCWRKLLTFFFESKLVQRYRYQESTGEVRPTPRKSWDPPPHVRGYRSPLIIFGDPAHKIRGKLITIIISLVSRLHPTYQCGTLCSVTLQSRVYARSLFDHGSTSRIVFHISANVFQRRSFLSNLRVFISPPQDTSTS